LLFESGRSITQAFRCWLLASEQVISCYICGHQIGTGAGYSPNFFDFALLFNGIRLPGQDIYHDLILYNGAFNCDLELWYAQNTYCNGTVLDLVSFVLWKDWVIILAQAPNTNPKRRFLKYVFRFQSVLTEKYRSIFVCIFVACILHYRRSRNRGY
jgi:hypothetical protein